LITGFYVKKCIFYQPHSIHTFCTFINIHLHFYRTYSSEILNPFNSSSNRQSSTVGIVTVLQAGWCVVKEKRGYWKLKEEALDHSLWRTHFGRGYGPAKRQTTEWIMMNKRFFLPSKTSRPTLGPSQPPTQWVLGFFPGRKLVEAWR
jgi:hypothetical protein